MGEVISPAAHAETIRDTLSWIHDHPVLSQEFEDEAVAALDALVALAERAVTLEAEKAENARYLLDDEHLARLSAIHARMEAAEERAAKLEAALAAVEMEIASAMTSLSTGPAKDGYAYSCLTDAKKVIAALGEAS